MIDLHSLELVSMRFLESLPHFDPLDFTPVELFRIWVCVTKYSLKQYYWVLTVRLSVQWFPNINPYMHPIYILMYTTDFFLNFFKEFVPNILGMDMSSMAAFICLEWMIRTLESIEFVTD
uniref:hypothetical protein n=1 Tax=Scytothamnus australis TaxID=66621 RepID=UPI002E765A57|nr:hypothetical protein V2495_pgp019 [Scytothamnus australis]WAM64790.1 hypothetical protein [Scytothamnus australis]